ncbi:hypothetical protein ACOSQ2_030839 [Xanthoceras sorbifolium]
MLGTYKISLRCNDLDGKKGEKVAAEEEPDMAVAAEEEHQSRFDETSCSIVKHCGHFCCTVDSLVGCCYAISCLCHVRLCVAQSLGC